MILALDLSLKSTGYAKFTLDGKLVEKGVIAPDKKLDNYFKINFITRRIEELLEGVDEVAIEDLYLGTNFAGIRNLAKLSGAVINSWINRKYKKPYTYMASRARKLIGISGSAQKIEIQLWVGEKYKFCKPTIITNYLKDIDTLKIQFKEKQMKKTKYKYQMTKLSKQFEKETGLGNDVADAIVVGLAYVEDTCQN